MLLGCLKWPAVSVKVLKCSRASGQFADQKWLFKETSILHIVPGSNNVDWCWKMLDGDVQTNPTLLSECCREFSIQCPQGESSKRRPNCACAQPTFFAKVVQRRTKCLMKRLNLIQQHPWPSSEKLPDWRMMKKLDYRRAQETSLVRIYCIPFLQCRGSIHCGPHWSSQL